MPDNTECYPSMHPFVISSIGIWIINRQTCASLHSSAMTTHRNYWFTKRTSIRIEALQCKLEVPEIALWLLFCKVFQCLFRALYSESGSLTGIPKTKIFSWVHITHYLDKKHNKGVASTQKGIFLLLLQLLYAACYSCRVEFRDVMHAEVGDL